MDGPLPVLRSLNDRSVVEATLRRLGSGDGTFHHRWDGATAYVLADVTAPLMDDTLALALCGPVDRSGEVALLEMRTRPEWPEAGPRLLAGVADRLRATGARRLVAPLQPVTSGGRAVLRAAGFRVDPGGGGPGRLVLDLWR